MLERLYLQLFHKPKTSVLNAWCGEHLSHHLAIPLRLNCIVLIYHLFETLRVSLKSFVVEIRESHVVSVLSPSLRIARLFPPSPGPHPHSDILVLLEARGLSECPPPRRTDILHQQTTLHPVLGS